MKNLENKIAEIKNYFTNKIINEEYKIVEKGNHAWTIKIDEIYVFRLWICNGWDHLKTYDGSFMNLDFTEDQKKQLAERIEKQIDEIEKAKKLEMFEKLKLELEK